jgi:hypothetical protein
MLIKRITVGLWGFAIAGIFILNCEKMDGPEPYLCVNQYNTLSLVKTDQVVSSIPLDALTKLVITGDAPADAILNMPGFETGLPISSIAKIVFEKDPNRP